MAAEPVPILTETLHQGRTFTIYRGRMPDGQPVLCKTPTARHWSPDAIARLENEFSITRGLSHPGQVKAQAMSRWERGPMLVCADEGERSLDLLRELPMDWREVERVALQLADILSDLHQVQGVVHRDLKPANVVADASLTRVRLIDYCLAIRAEDLAREQPGAFAAKGTLAYMAPEQSGRMNRGVDWRADLYGLGVLLYELLTGRLPFEDDDPAGLVHLHLTAIPPSPRDLRPEVPARLSDAVMTLMRKNPEDRFQSARELAHALDDTGEAGGLGRVPGTLRIPDRLYGRDTLVERLGGLIAHGSRGPSRMLRIAGPSGIGKSALIERLLAPTLAAGGHFIQGKFEQHDRARPYAPFVQAFNALLRTLLAGSAAEVETWRAHLSAALSPNARVLTDLLPGYEALLGPQPPVPALGLNEAQTRMSLVFRRFVGALARAESPLVLFVDDLQWSDSASRALIELVMCDPEIRNLTLLTAHRDSEVGPGHPLTQLFESLDARIGLEPVVSVGPLGEDAVSALLADCLGQPPQTHAGLAAAVVSKTGGNPFFVGQFLRALERKGLLRYDPAAGRWTWDAAAIEGEQITDNVADLVIERILELPQATREAVQFAACHGSALETAILALAADREPAEIMRVLAPALEADIICRADEGADALGLPARLRFQHDRIQEAAHTLMPAELRGRTHARIGALLLANIPDPAGAGRLTEITDHLIAGRDYLDAAHQRALRDLAVAAARITKSAIAYDAAMQYLDVAEDCLGEDRWEHEPDLAFEIALEKAQAAYLQDRIEVAEGIAGDLLGRRRPALDLVRVLNLMVVLHTSRLAYADALDVGLRALSLLGERLPRHASVARVATELALTKARLAGRSDADLRALPAMSNAAKAAAMQTMVLLAPPAYFSAPNLLPLIALRMVQLSVRYGNAPQSAYAYALYGMLHCAVLADPRRGLAFADLARELASQLDARDLEGRILMIYAGFIQHWVEPLAQTLPVFLEGAEKALVAGDLEHHGYNHYGHASYALMAGLPLAKVSDLLAHHQAAESDNRHEKTRRIMRMAADSIARLRGLAEVPAEPREATDGSLALWTAQRDATSLAYFHKYRMLEALMRADYGEVLARAKGMEANLNGIVAMAYEPFYAFYEALALIHGVGEGTQPRRSLLRARWLLSRLTRWARVAPDTFAHRVRLLRAELAAVLGRPREAMGCFDTAIAGARRAGALHDIGLFLERAGRFYLRQGAETAATGYFSEAVAALEVWGAGAWARALQARHGDLVRTPLRAGADSGESILETSGRLQIVDSATLIRAAAALAQKVSLREVVTEVMRAMVINAGATRGCLLLHDGDGLAVAAEGSAQGAELVSRDPGDLAQHRLPVGLINYVQRARVPVVLDDARADPDLRSDPHVRAHALLSVLCVPLLSKGELVGVVYLENHAVRGAFSPERRVTVETLGAQAAVSIENARLYDTLRGSLERQTELTSAHARFVPHQFLETLGRPSICDVRVGDHVQAKASILFSDIRGFTLLLERMRPVDAIAFVNTYLSRMEPAVLAQGGFVDNYVGDAIMAVFDRGPDAAVAAGIAMQRSLTAWSQAREGAGEAPVRVGVGIATGELIFGTIGAANRLKCGVVGDTVNLASRIEGLTKHYGLGLLIGQRTYLGLSDPARLLIREVDRVTVAGRETPVELYEVFDADAEQLREQKLRTRDLLAEGLAELRAGRSESALRAFESCIARAPDDPLPKRLTERARQEAAHRPSPGRVVRMLEK